MNNIYTSDIAYLNMSHMFGDVFGNKADYVKGMMYASRNQYLVGKDRRGYDYRQKHHKIHVRHMPCRPEILHPPDLFLTRAQARKKAIRSEQRNLKRLDFKQRPVQKNLPRSHKMEEKKELKPRRQSFTEQSQYTEDEERSDIDSVDDDPKINAKSRDAWEQVLQAGVTFWFNVVTGEAQVESPFEEDEVEMLSVPEEEETFHIISEEEYERNNGLFAFLSTDNWEVK